MRISLDWLKAYVDVTWADEELAQRLTMAGLEVSGIERVGAGLDQVVVGQILATGPHPNADRLSLCRVTDGGEVFDIVCGASNISFGMPNRHLLDSVFVPMAIGAGMNCAITNPLHSQIRNAIYAADVMMGHDPDSMRYLSAMRAADAKAAGQSDAEAAGSSRRDARAARRAARRSRSEAQAAN